MTKPSLSALYRRLTAGAEAQSVAAADVDALARLVAGEHLGEHHDATLAMLARSPAHASALRVASAIAPAAEILSHEANALDRVLPAHRARRATVRGVGRGWRWAALAASVAVGFALLLSRQAPVATDAPVAVQAPVPKPEPIAPGDQILFGSFEEASPALDGVNGERAPQGESIFVDDFGA